MAQVKLKAIAKAEGRAGLEKGVQEQRRICTKEQEEKALNVFTEKVNCPVGRTQARSTAYTGPCESQQTAEL